MASLFQASVFLPNLAEGDLNRDELSMLKTIQSLLNSRPLIRCLVFMTLLMNVALWSPSVWSLGDELASPDWLDGFYVQYRKQEAASLGRYSTIQDLTRTLDSSVISSVRKTALITNNIEMLLAHVETDAFNDVLSFLFERNEFVLIRQFLSDFESRYDSLGTSKIYFHLAKYHESRHGWEQVLAALDNVDTTALTQVNMHYAQLLRGVAMQGLKQHRQVEPIYDRIPESSPYFPHAKLNKAIAFLRQGWWTEAHIEINTALNSPIIPEFQELNNRLRNTLAYSQMHEGFYRDARETFRDIELDSPHANKGLMGLALCAAYQKDYVGALNAFAILKKRPEQDLSVDESFLLVPFIYEQLDQLSTASVAYAEAVTYFENRILAVKNLKQRYLKSAPKDLAELIQESGSTHLHHYDIEATVAPHQYHQLEYWLAIQADGSAPHLQNNINKHVDRIVESIKGSAMAQLDKRLEILGSYAGQAKYGIAKLYDE